MVNPCICDTTDATICHTIELFCHCPAAATAFGIVPGRARATAGLSRGEYDNYYTLIISVARDVGRV